MYQDMIELKAKFERIKNMGYVKSSRGGSTGIGKTFEDLIGKEEDTLETPDYKHIEIKTKRGYSNSYTTLFNATLEGPHELETQRLKNKYGYPDRILKDCKVLNATVQADCFTLVANRYYFKLKVDRKKGKVFLIIADKRYYLYEQNAYWSFALLKEKLERKLKFLALVKAWPNKINNEDYYKYYDIKFYKLKSFDYFIDLLEKGLIKVTFKMGVYRSGERFKEPKDRGTSFEIQEENLELLFDKLEIENK